LEILHRASETIGSYEHGNEHSVSIKGKKFLVTVSFSRTLLHVGRYKHASYTKFPLEFLTERNQ